MIGVAGINVKFEGELDDGFERGFMTSFARRYLPDVFPTKGNPHVVVKRVKGGGFRVLNYLYDYNGIDEYLVESQAPEAYENEAPVFFLLQAVARAGAKIGKIFITDSVAVSDGRRGVLFVGYPHTGKSTISALSLSHGLTVLSTENTVVDAKSLRIVGGTTVLIYDPRIEDLYNVRLPYDSLTRSGYRVKEIESEKRRKILGKVKVNAIVILHSAFNCKGASFSPVKGRKIKKSLWYFSTALIKGVDYYEPQPLNMPVNEVMMKNLEEFLERASKVKMYEAFGNHLDVFKRSLELIDYEV
ncbi:hypothetical protein [Pyrococcus kukulkanii]|uniref:hypothetical protein n=1 Tax=Pyrococcus kukulkanii TaxID=1609559 RepID=UPI0035659934